MSRKLHLDPTLQAQSFLRDGFQELFEFKDHSKRVRGFRMVEPDTHGAAQHSAKSLLNFISWDAKTIILWSYNTEDLDDDDDKNDDNMASNKKEPVIIKKLKFKQSNYIPAIVYVTKMKIFIAASLDMTFRIYDRNLNLLETIKHEEAAVSQLEYNSKRDVFVVGGKSGLSVWRVYRHITASVSHVVEKLYVFSGLDNVWVTNLIMEEKDDKMYVIEENCVKVLGWKKKGVISNLDKIHEAPVTKALWYARSQFYVTACSAGLIKCWTSFVNTSHDNNNPLNNSNNAIRRKQSNMSMMSVDMDVEEEVNNFTLMHTFYAHTLPVTGLVLGAVPGLALSASLDGFVKILNLEAFYTIYSIYPGYSITSFKTSIFLGTQGCLLTEPSGKIKVWKSTPCCGFYGAAASKLEKVVSLENVLINNVNVEDKDIKKSNILGFDKFIVAEGFHDYRCYNEKGGLVCLLDAETIADGIVSSCISVNQELIYCLFESGSIKIYCMRSFVCPLLFTSPAKNVEIDIGKSITIINCMISNSRRISNENPKNARGEAITQLQNNPGYSSIMSEILVVASKAGVLTFYDAFDNCELLSIVQTAMGEIKQLLYKKNTKELFVFAVDTAVSSFHVCKVYKLPDVTCTHELYDIQDASCFAISYVFPTFAIGSSDGYVKIYNMHDTHHKPVELNKQTYMHASRVVTVHFNDDLKIYLSCSIDGTAIIWDWSMQFVRSLKFNEEMKSCLWIGHTFIITQSQYLLIVGKGIWDKDDHLQMVRDFKDPWVQAWDNGQSNEVGDFSSSTVTKKIKGGVKEKDADKLKIIDDGILLNTKSEIKSEIGCDAKQLVTNSCSIVHPSTMDYNERKKSIGKPLNIFRPRFVIHNKPSVYIHDTATGTTTTSTDAHDVAETLNSMSLCIRPPSAEVPSKYNRELSPRVSVEYLQTRGLTYGMGIGNVSNQPIIIVDKATGMPKLSKPSYLQPDEEHDDDEKDKANKGPLKRAVRIDQMKEHIAKMKFASLKDAKQEIIDAKKKAKEDAILDRKSALEASMPNIAQSKLVSNFKRDKNIKTLRQKAKGEL